MMLPLIERVIGRATLRLGDIRKLGGPIGGELASLAGEATPYLSAAVGAYGGAVLAKVRDDAADATAGMGRRLLQRVFGTRSPDESLPDSLDALVADPDDGDALAAVRLAVRQALAVDPVMEAEVRAMLAGVPGVTQQVRAGRDAYVAGHHQTVVNYRLPGEWAE